MKVEWTDHARERAQERSGLSAKAIERLVWEAYCSKAPGYFPQHSPNECWVKVDGPKGKATAICSVNRDQDGVVIITVRESETAGQGERANEKFTHRPFAAALKDWGKK